MMIKRYLENASTLKSQSDATIFSRAYRDPHVNNIKTAALSMKIVQNDIIFREESEDIDYYDENLDISLTKKKQAWLSNNTRIWNDDDSLTATTIEVSIDDLDDEYDDNASLTSTMAVSEGELSDDIMVPKMPKKSVHFGNAIIREYSVTVGAFASTNETCPIQLSWEYDSKEKKTDINFNESVNLNHWKIDWTSNSRRCKRLSLEERRLRIANVQNMTLYDVENLECEIMIEQLKIEEENILKLKDENNDDIDSEEE